MKHALSFDIEDWFHMIDIDGLDDVSLWDNFDSIVVEMTELILELLQVHDTKATFFILGWIAKKYPSLVKKISKHGHEIGSHSYYHKRVYKLSRQEFYDDLKMSLDILQDLSGKKVYGFRAPSFSIIEGTEWAFEVISELNLLYDASLFPTVRGHGGYNCQNFPHFINYNQVNLPELPLSVYESKLFKLPFSGGGYLRLLPLWLINMGFKKFENEHKSVVVYLHPRDFCLSQPRVKMPLNRRFKSYVGLNTTKSKLNYLLKNYKFTTCIDVLVNNLKINF